MADNDAPIDSHNDKLKKTNIKLKSDCECMSQIGRCGILDAACSGKRASQIINQAQIYFKLLFCSTGKRCEKAAAVP